MRKSPHDFRSLSEVVTTLLGERTSAGDNVSLRVKYNGRQRPTAILFFGTNDPSKMHLPSEEEITDFLPAEPNSPYKYSDGTIDPSRMNGFNTWQDYVRNGRGLRGTIEERCRVRGLRFSFDDGSGR